MQTIFRIINPISNLIKDDSKLLFLFLFQKVALSNVDMLTKKNEELQDLLDKLERDTANMKIDDAVVTTAPLYSQLVILS